VTGAVVAVFVRGGIIFDKDHVEWGLDMYVIYGGCGRPSRVWKRWNPSKTELLAKDEDDGGVVTVGGEDVGALNPALSLATGFINPCHQFPFNNEGAWNENVLVNRTALLKERYLSASLYRPNDGWVRWNECTRRVGWDRRWSQRGLVKKREELGVEPDEILDLGHRGCQRVSRHRARYREDTDHVASIWKGTERLKIERVIEERRHRACLREGTPSVSMKRSRLGHHHWWRRKGLVKKREVDSVGVEPEEKAWVATPRQEKKSVGGNEILRRRWKNLERWNPC
jgi:hypothetical protein